MIIVALLLSSLMMPGVFAAGTDLDPRDVYVSDTMISYAYTENDRTMVIMVYPQENRAELAYGYAGESEMYSAEILLPAAATMPYSSKYWKAVELLALDSVAQWNEKMVEPIERVSYEIETVTGHYDVMDRFIEDTFGGDYYGYHLSNRVMNGVPFTLLEGQESWIIDRGERPLTEAQTNAEMVYEIINFIWNFVDIPNPYSLIIDALLILAGGYLDSLEHVQVYEINCDIFRYVSEVSDEDAPYTMADHMIYYIALANPDDMGEDPVILDEAVHEYMPSQTFFNSYDAQFEEAYAVYQRMN